MTNPTCGKYIRIDGVKKFVCYSKTNCCADEATWRLRCLQAHRRQTLSTHDTLAPCSVTLITILRNASKNKPLKQEDSPHDSPIRLPFPPQLNTLMYDCTQTQRSATEHEQRNVYLLTAKNNLDRCCLLSCNNRHDAVVSTKCCELSVQFMLLLIPHNAKYPFVLLKMKVPER